MLRTFHGGKDYRFKLALEGLYRRIILQSRYVLGHDTHLFTAYKREGALMSHRTPDRWAILVRSSVVGENPPTTKRCP